MKTCWKFVFFAFLCSSICTAWAQSTSRVTAQDKSGAAQRLTYHGGQLTSAQAGAMDRDLLEITIPGLEKLYAKHRYTVREVTQWYLERIDRYDGTYRAMLYLDKKGALQRAAEEDTEPAVARHGALWGVPSW